MPTQTQTLPEIIAITSMRDFGPSEGEGSTSCPHCGARGRLCLGLHLCGWFAPCSNAWMLEALPCRP